MPANEPNKETVISFPKLDKFHEIEIQQVFEALLSIQNLRVQSGIFFATANVTALGVAFTTTKAGIIFIACLLILGFMIIDSRGRSSFAALYYRGLQLQRQYAPNDTDTFLSLIVAGYLEKEIREIEKLANREERINALKALPIKSPGLSTFLLPLIALIIEIVIGLIAWLIFSWSLF